MPIQQFADYFIQIGTNENYVILYFIQLIKIMKVPKKIQFLKPIERSPLAIENDQLKETLKALADNFIKVTDKMDQLIQTMHRSQKGGDNGTKNDGKLIPVNEEKRKQVGKHGQESNMKGSQQATQSSFEDIKEVRFRDVNIQLPRTHQIANSSIGTILINWLGVVLKQTYAVGFNMLKDTELDINKVKAYCSENFLRNLLRFSQQFQLTPQIFENVNKCLVEDLLPYFCLKYPQTEEKQINKKFADLLIERDTMGDSENDLIARSGIKFILQSSGNYNSQIMQFLNFIIKLPSLTQNQILKKQNDSQPHQEELTIGNQFYRQMEEIFLTVYSEEKKFQALRFDPKNPDKIDKTSKKVASLDSLSKQRNLAQQKQLLEYKEKVKSYTSYQIGQKLSLNFRTFTASQIQSGILKLNNSAILRVVTKWCEELQKCFDEKQILDREYPFKMKNGSQKFLSMFQLQVLNLFLQREKKYIQSQLLEIQKNNFKLQYDFSKAKINQQLLKFVQDQALVGQFASSLFNINESYLIKYLNMLIHGINKAIQDFQKFQYFYTSNNETSFELQNMNKQVYDEAFLTMLTQYINKYEYFDIPEQTPELITFKIGDLLRCKCTSKEDEIISLYRLIEKINHTNPQKIKILRVKNKLDQGNKDILMNLLFKNCMLVQMQLAIKSQKSKFIENSNKFNHYFYEMKRSKFGPIIEMSNIWISQDLRSQLYLKKLEELNKRHSQISKTKNKQCCRESKNIKKIDLPFCCKVCSCFYYDCNKFQQHTACQVCKKQTCFLCRYETGSKQFKEELLPEIKSVAGMNLNSITYLNQIPQKGGAFINLKQKQRKVVIFNSIYYNQEYYLFKVENNEEQGTKNQIKLIRKFKNKNLDSSFLNSNIIFTSEKIKNLIPNLLLSQTEISQFIPKYLLNCNKKFKKSVILIKKKFNVDEIFKKNKQLSSKSWPAVQKLNLSQNNFNNVDILPTKFPNAEFVVLSKNSIQSFSSTAFNEWKNLKNLFLTKNSIADMQPIVEKFPQLMQLNLSQNKIRKVPDSIKKLAQLKKFDISDNPIASVPHSIGNLKNLQVLNISYTLIIQLPPQFGMLENLKVFNFLKNSNLASLPEQQLDNKESKLSSSFSQLKQLQIMKIYLKNPNSSTIPVQQLKALKVIELQYNPQADQNQIVALMKKCRALGIQIKSSDVGSKVDLSRRNLSSLPTDLYLQLSQLDISHNRIKQLRQDFNVFSNIKKLNASYNILKTIPKCFEQLILLKKLVLSKCIIQKLPDQICNMKSLISLDVSFNVLDKLPDHIGNLKLMQILDISCNSLTELPQSFGELQSITDLLIHWNIKIKQLPASFCNLKSIRNIQMSNCYSLTKLPAELGNLRSIQHLNMSCVLLENLPSTFGQLENVKYLKLFLKQMSIDVKQLKNLQQFHLQYISKISENEKAKILLIQNYCSRKQIKFTCNQVKLTALYDSQNAIQLSNLINSQKWLKQLTIRKVLQIPESITSLSNLLVLSLQSCIKLEELPEYLCNLPLLSQFKISNTAIKRLPSSIGNLKNLTLLSVSYNKHLTQIPQSVSNLIYLKTLHLNSNNLLALPNSINNLISLQTINLEQNYNLATLPDSICYLQKIKQLYICKNNILEQLPEDLGNLSSLQRLDISFMRSLKKLPQSIGKLKKLSVLDMYSIHCLKRLPDSFGDLESLTSLDMAYTRGIDQLPESFKNLKLLRKFSYNQLCPRAGYVPFEELKSLKQLNIQYSPPDCQEGSDIDKIKQICKQNNIALKTQEDPVNFIYEQKNMTELYSFVPSCHWLKKLVLSNNKLKQLPDSIENLQSLKILSLAANLFQQLPSSVGKLKKLEDLNISQNPSLAKLPQSFTNLPSLLILKMNELVELKQLPHQFGNLKKLKHIQMMKLHSLKKLPQSFYELGCLQNLNMAYTYGITFLPTQSASLQRLAVLKANQPILKFQDYPIQKMVALKTLTLYYEQLQSEDQINLFKEACQKQNISLTLTKDDLSLSFANQKLNQIPSFVTSCQWLKKIVLGSNNIKTFPSTFTDLCFLVHLDIENNQNLQQLPENIGNLTSLQFLNIRYNSLVQLPQSLGNLTKLQHLDMTNLRRLKKLPNSFGNLKSLKKLIMENVSSLSKLPSSFGNLTALQDLNLTKNFQVVAQLIKFEKLVELSTLKVSLMKITPDFSIKNFAKLQDLTIEYVKQDQPQSNIQKLKSMCAQKNVSLTLLDDKRFLQLNLIGMSKIHDFVLLCKWVRILDLSANHLKTLPHQFGQLTSLQKLDLRSNQLQQLPESIGNLVQLTHLNISQNMNLEQLPIEFGNLRSLTHLYLNKNVRLEELPHSFGNLYSLQQLEMKGTFSLQYLPKSFQNLKKLQNLQLYLYDPRLQSVPLLKLVSLKYLYIEFNNQEIDNEMQIIKRICSQKQIQFQFAPVARF